MYEHEFEKIWGAQAAYHPVLLAPERKKELKRAIFYQRPLRFPRELVGHCELKPDETRAPRHYFIAQRFRLLQGLNNLLLAMPGEAERALTSQERTQLDNELELNGDQTFGQIRKLLALKRATFNLENGGEKLLHGNRTTANFYKAFGDRWLEMFAAEHEQALQDVYRSVSQQQFPANHSAPAPKQAEPASVSQQQFPANHSTADNRQPITFSVSQQQFPANHS